MKHVNTSNNELHYFILLSKIISYDTDTFSFFHRSEKFFLRNFLVSGSKASSSKEVNLGDEIRGQFLVEKGLVESLGSFLILV